MARQRVRGPFEDLVTSELNARRNKVPSLTAEERQRYEEAQKRYEQIEADREAERYKPKEEFLRAIGVCDDSGQAHQVMKLTFYEYEPDTSGMISLEMIPSIRSKARYYCAHCKVAFDPSIDPAHQESYPIQHRSGLYR